MPVEVRFSAFEECVPNMCDPITFLGHKVSVCYYFSIYSVSFNATKIKKLLMLIKQFFNCFHLQESFRSGLRV